MKIEIRKEIVGDALTLCAYANGDYIAGTATRIDGRASEEKALEVCEERAKVCIKLHENKGLNELVKTFEI